MHRAFFIALCSLFFIGCGRDDDAPIEPARLVAIADSAATVAWGEFEWRGATSADSAVAIWYRDTVLARHDSLPHSRFFDSVYRFVSQAVRLEAERRRASDSVVKLAPFAPSRLTSPQSRVESRRLMQQYASYDSLSKSRLDRLFGAYAQFVRRRTDTLYHDEVLRSEAREGLLNERYFYPYWRLAYDSLERDVITTYTEILTLLDTARQHVGVDGVVKFFEPRDLMQYRDLLMRIDSLSAKENAILTSLQTRKPTIDTLPLVSHPGVEAESEKKSTETPRKAKRQSKRKKKSRR